MPAISDGAAVNNLQPWRAPEYADFPRRNRLTRPARLLYTDEPSVVNMSFCLGEENPCAS